MVERWRRIAARVAPRGVPVALILAVIEMESGGRTGKRGSAGDNGLMQCKPSVVEDYRRHHPGTTITHDRMSETTHDAGVDQIRVGSWLIGHHLREVHKIDPARAPWPRGDLSVWQVELADLRYSRGAAAVGQLRDAVLAAGYPDDLEGWWSYREKFLPAWGKPGRPFWHAAKVAAMWREGGGTRAGEPIIARYDRPERPPRIKPDREYTGQAAMALAALTFLVLLARRG